MLYEEIKNKSSQDFKRLTGVHYNSFKKMVEVVKTYVLKHKKTGRNNKLTIEDQILLTLAYYREYRTYFHWGQEYGLNESNVYRTIKKIEKILRDSGIFSLPGKKSLSDKNNTNDIIIIDVTEIEIERPKKKQRKNYSG